MAVSVPDGDFQQASDSECEIYFDDDFICTYQLQGKR